MELEAIAQIGIPVKDLKQATDFYKQKLELPLLFETETIAFFECGGIRLLLSLPENAEFALYSSIIYFRTDDIHSSFEKFRGKGVSFTGAPHRVSHTEQTETWLAFFNDTEGNLHALTSEVSIQAEQSAGLDLNTK